MTTDLECQELQKRGERKRERERERKKERERHPTDVYASLFVLFHSHSLLSSCSLFTCGSLSLSLSLSLCVCVRMWTCTRMLSFTHPFLLSFSVSLSQTYTHTVEQSKIIDVKQLLDCGQKKCSKRASWKHAHARASSHAQTRAHKKGYKLTEYTSLVCLV